MKQLLVAMLMAVLVCAPVIGESAPGGGARSSGGFSKGSPGRAAPARGPSRGSPQASRRSGPGVGAPGPGARPGPGVGAPGPGVRPGPGVGAPGPGARPGPPRRRPHGHHYYGYGHWHSYDDAWKFLAFTAITLKILDNINEQAQREHEAAQVEATTAPVGKKIAWETTDASGYVVATKRGIGSSGLQCREFQQEITVGGKTEEAYGTACLQEDGSWKITE